MTRESGPTPHRTRSTLSAAPMRSMSPHRGAPSIAGAGALALASLMACGDAGEVAGGSSTVAGTSGSSGAIPTSSASTDMTTGADTSAPDSSPEPTTTDTTAALACVAASECPVAVPECRSAECVDGACVFKDMSEGTLLADQVPGDCRALVCDGAGAQIVVVDADDPEDDGVLCTLDACDGATPIHTPGLTACYSGDPATADVGACSPGTQQCDDDGVPVGRCVGEVVPAAEHCDLERVDEDCDGLVNESGRACVCVPDAAVPCYNGPDGTLGTGACHGGIAVCDGDGLDLGACDGELTPGLEDCDPALVDEDCDGAVNESGPACTCGDGFVSVGEVCDDGNTVDDDACSADCSHGLEVLEIKVGIGSTCARVTGGRVKCWGSNYGGGLGLGDTEDRGDEPGEMGANLPFVELGAGLIAAELVHSSASVCARFEDGHVKCWGFNGDGTLGLGDTEDRGDEPGEMGDALPFVNLGTGRHALALQGAAGAVCALLDDARVKCWGFGGGGILGNAMPVGSVGKVPGQMGDNLPYINLAGGPVTAIDMGDFTACALHTSGATKCWAQNQNGQLGLGDKNHRGDEPGEMGNALPFVPLGVGTVASVQIGATHACARFTDSSLRCWGRGLLLGQGISDPFYNIGDQPGEMGAALATVDLGDGVLDFAIGPQHSCARLIGGATKCWGRGLHGALGSGSEDYLGDQPGELGDALPIVDLGTGRSAVAIDLGYFTACAILDDKSVKCWGYNSGGRLGIGDEEDRGDQPGEMGDALPAVQVF